MDSLLIIIVTFNGKSHIKQCLKDIKNIPNSEIIIIDNHSDDDTVQIIKNIFPNITLITNEKNIGFGQANNIGFRYALEKGFHFVLLLNQDTYIDKKAITSLLNVMDSNKEYGILSPLHFYSENKLQKSFSYHIKSNTKLVKDLENNILNQEIYDVPFVNAAIWLLSKECIEKVGGFCPEFFHYGEDDNYCHRVQFRGYKIGVVPTIKGFHLSLDKHPKYFENKEAELWILQQKINILNPNIHYNLRKEMLILSMRIFKSILFLRKKTRIQLIQRFKSLLTLDLKELKKIKYSFIHNELTFIKNRM